MNPAFSPKSLIEKISFPKVLFWIGFIATIALVSAVLISGRTFNFEIFRFATLDAWSGQNPYISWEHIGQRGGYLDRFQYPPLFSVLFVPFALPPIWLGGMMWVLFSYVITFWSMGLTRAYRSSASGYPDRRLAFVFLYTIIVLISSLQAFQYNALNGAFCLLILYFLEHKKYTPAMLLVVVGGLTKVYPGFAALLFFFYPDFWRRPKLILLGIGMFIVGLLLPMLFTGVDGLIPYTMDWLKWMEAKDLTRCHGLTSLIDHLGYREIINYSLPLLLLGTLLPFLKSWIMLFFGKIQNNYTLRATQLGTLMVGLLVWSNSSEANTWIIGMLGWLLFYFAKEERTLLDKTLTALLYITFGILPMDFLCPVPISKYLLFDLRIGAIVGTLLWIRMFLYTPHKVTQESNPKGK